MTATMTNSAIREDLVDPREAYRLCERQVAFRLGTGDSTDTATDGRTLEGYAAVFDVSTRIDSYEGEFEEIVKPGAFKKTLRARQPVMQFNHGRDKRTGAVPIGAIKDLHEDSEGLFVRARLFDNDVVEPIRQAVEAKAIRGMSFKFEVLQDRWTDDLGNVLSSDERASRIEAGEPIRREITEVKLYELGPVVFPAYDQTSVGVRDRTSPFDTNQVALRGVLSQFGLDERCVHRHLSLFDSEARTALAEEIAATFPELLAVMAREADGREDKASGEPPEGHSTGEPEQSETEPPEQRHSTIEDTDEPPAAGHSTPQPDRQQRAKYARQAYVTRSGVGKKYY